MFGQILRKLLAIAVLVILVALYGFIYVRTAARSSGRARRAGGYFHYRTVNADWQAYVFIPAAFVESWVIRIDPKPFLTQPSWADVPQLLILQSPNHNFDFHASWNEFSTE